jgi:hypothetical protein
MSRYVSVARKPVVAGAGLAECYTVPAAYWIDLVRH